MYYTPTGSVVWNDSKHLRGKAPYTRLRFHRLNGYKAFRRTGLTIIRAPHRVGGLSHWNSCMADAERDQWWIALQTLQSALHSQSQAECCQLQPWPLPIAGRGRVCVAPVRLSVHLSRASHLLYQQKAHVFKFFFFEISFCSVFSYSSKTDG